MKKQLELVDVLVWIGMVVTVVGAYAFFQVTVGGATPATPAVNQMTDFPLNVLVQAKLQPAMGQAIVDRAGLDRQFAEDIIHGASKLASAVRAAERPSHERVEQVEARAAQMEADHHARVQYVMGRSIVIGTRQGMRAGALSADTLSNSVNGRIIEKAQARGRQMHDAFTKHWQARLGQWIVAAAAQARHSAGHFQERIGQATVDLARIQHVYQTKRAHLQTQFEALTAAARRTAAQPDLLAQAPQADPNWPWALGISTLPQVEVVETRPAPELPVLYFLVASAGFATLLYGWPRLEKPPSSGGRVTVSGGEQKSESVVSGREEQIREQYRKAG
jgi:hypothetical protein